MQSFFDRYHKAIITGCGVLIFIAAGLMTMFLTESKHEVPPENQEVKTEIAVTESSQPEKLCYVYITGEVQKPGVYKLSEDARIFQLVDMAGGFTKNADKESLNLADNVTDGTHIHVSAKISPSRSNPTIPGLPAQHVIVQSHQTQSTKIDINRADAQELERLKGVGPAIAKRIIEYRQKHGRFMKPEDIMNVRGIGQKTFEKIKDNTLIR